MKNKVGMAGSKSTQTRDIKSHLLYIPTLAFLNYFAPINVAVFVECGHDNMGDIQLRLFPSYVVTMVWVHQF